VIHHTEILKKAGHADQVCNLSHSGSRDQGCESSPGKKVSETLPSKLISQAWWCMPVIPATPEAIDRRIKSEASPRHNHETLSEK
jgi:hypothetical protein